MPYREQHMSACIYRCYDKEGNLLYVGLSRDAIIRSAAHSAQSAWYPNVAVMKIEKFSSREDAEEAERRAIAAENPLHNKMRFSFSASGDRTKKPPRAPRGNGKVTDSAAAKVVLDRLKEQGRTVAGLCRDMGISRQTFYNVISGHSDPKKNTLVAISKATGLPMEKIGRGS
jgi:hypothetical protein